jgi:hypothetical protein
MPSDPAHEAMMPYTALGKETMDSHKAGFGEKNLELGIRYLESRGIKVEPVTGDSAR